MANTAVVKSTDRTMLRLETPRGIAVDAHRDYVVSGWAIMEPSPPQAGARLTRRAARGSGAYAHAKLASRGMHERPLAEAILNLYSQAPVTFSQRVIKSADLDLVAAADDTTYAPSGSIGDRLPDGTETISYSLLAAPRAAIGPLTITSAQHFSFDNRNRGH
jgi:hypothetical protein